MRPLVWALAAAGLVIAVLSWGVLRGAASVDDINRESTERIHQTCSLFERAHLSDVQRLRRLYQYLGQLRPDERDDAINRFVLATLPETEREARIDTAPEYCDRRNVGLPEPDPVVPRRPKFLR